MIKHAAVIYCNLHSVKPTDQKTILTQSLNVLEAFKWEPTLPGTLHNSSIPSSISNHALIEYKADKMRFLNELTYSWN